MIDPHGRQINYLRISVTDRCNLRCVYCMPPEGVPLLPHEDLLTFEEICRILRIGASLGITKVRLTGGEPLVRKDIEKLVRSISQTPGIEQAAMTTNGVLLPQHARALKENGLGSVNISLDTLRPERYRRITRTGKIEDVLRGIDAALAAGFEAVKINVVVMRGTNDDEIQDFARLTLDRPVHVSFIEFMAIGRTSLADPERLVPAAVVLEELRKVGKLKPVAPPRSAGPAEMYRLEDAIGAIGLIAAVTGPFCGRCNRLRLTSEGKLRSCLIGGGEIDLRSLLRRGCDDSHIAQAFKEAAAMKPLERSCVALANMSRIGG